MKTTHSPPVPETWTVEVDALDFRDLFERQTIYRSGVAVAERCFFAPAVIHWLDDRAPGIACRWDYGELDGADPVVHPFTHEDLSDHESDFDAPSTARLLERVRTALTGLQLGPYLNTNRVQAQFLVSGGFIKPVVDGTDEEGSWRCFAREDVDEFLAALTRKAQPAEAASPGAHRIKDAAKRACCHSGEIVDLILSDRLTWVGRAADETGFDAVLVDVDEVRRHVRGPELSGMTLNEAYKTLGMNSRAWNELVAAGGIGTVVERHPVNRAPLRIVPFAEVERFRETYVSLFQAAAEADLHHLVLKRRLSAAGVAPAFDPDAFRITLYARNAVAQALGFQCQGVSPTPRSDA